MSEVNIDARLVASPFAATTASRPNRTAEKLVEFSNGCICCTLREDLLEEVAKLAREGRFDYLLVESTGTSEPLPLAETFTFIDERGESLSSLARLDTLVTVVDAHDLASLQAILRRLDPAARIVVSQLGRVPMGAVLDTTLFDMTQAASHPGWLAFADPFPAWRIVAGEEQAGDQDRAAAAAHERSGHSVQSDGCSFR